MTSQQAGLVQRMAALDEDGRPYVQATVVRAQRPTSTWAGATAIVLPDGSIEGFVGGMCAESSVRAAAVAALESGEPVLLRILPEGADDFPEAPGAQTVVNPCLSGGAIEVFLAPHVPPPAIVVTGDTPIADAVDDLARVLGFRVVRSEELPAVPGGVIAVIGASHGGSEAETLRAALDAGIGFIGLVASTRRGQAVLDELDLQDDERARIRTPVGLDIGARTAEEIALSILAAVVKAIRLEGLAGGRATSDHATPDAGGTTGPVTAVDPICGMTVLAAPPTLSLEVGGATSWFCSPGCRDQFAQQSSVDMSAPAG